jgi:hypothetical protein
MRTPEDLLRKTLHERVDGRDLPPTPMSDVVSRAGRIRRRRRVRNGVVAAAVVAVLATPFVIDAVHRPGTSPTPTDPSSTDANPYVLLKNVTLGDPPAVSWIDGSDYVAADGTRTTLPLEGVTNATPYRGGFLVAVTGPDLGPRVVLLDRDLKQVWRRCGQGTFAVSDRGLRTAYTTGDCRSSRLTLRLGVTEVPASVSNPLIADEQVQDLPVEQSIPAGVIGETVVAGSLPGARPLVVDFADQPAAIRSLGGARSVDESSHLVAGQLAGRPGTAAVIDADTDTVLWDRRGWALEDFSPDGSMVLGIEIGDGVRGSGGFGVFDARTGELLHAFAQLAGFQAQQTVWEDDEHLLSVTTEAASQAIVRLTLDGAMQRATRTSPYAPGSQDVALRFAPRP